jgi:hypothetical protein
MTHQDWYLSDDLHQGLARLLRDEPLIKTALDVLQTANVPATNYGTDPVRIALIHAEQAGFQKALEAFVKLSRLNTVATKKPLQEWSKPTTFTETSSS